MSATKGAPQVTDLPLELLEHIARHADLVTILRLRSTCQRVRAAFPDQRCALIIAKDIRCHSFDEISDQLTVPIQECFGTPALFNQVLIHLDTMGIPVGLRSKGPGTFNPSQHWASAALAYAACYARISPTESLKSIAQLFRAGASPNKQDEEKCEHVHVNPKCSRQLGHKTALSHAVTARCLPVIELLLTSGTFAYEGLFGGQQEAPLLEAIVLQDVDIVTMLFAAVEKQDVPLCELMFAIVEWIVHYDNGPALEFLISSMKIDLGGPAFAIFQTVLDEIIRLHKTKDHTQVLRIYLHHYGLPQEDDEMMHLHHQLERLAQLGHTEALTCLLDSGLDVSICAGNGPATAALRNGHKELAERLIQAGSRLHVINFFKASYEAELEYLLSRKLLTLPDLQCGLSALTRDLRNAHFKNSWRVARMCKTTVMRHMGLISRFLSLGAKAFPKSEGTGGLIYAQPLCVAAGGDNIPLFKLLLSSCPPEEHRQCLQDAAMHAAREGSFRILLFIVESLHCWDDEKKGRDVLCAAIRRKWMDEELEHFERLIRHFRALHIPMMCSNKDPLHKEHVACPLARTLMCQHPRQRAVLESLLSNLGVDFRHYGAVSESCLNLDTKDSSCSFPISMADAHELAQLYDQLYLAERSY
ncbi:hypothetical protein DFS34DRAFT_594707 [Phlyctochytrium arcticum]|nr:hypothetical protein DFS34DRAFT_594707 [Phlyctochytrium arcticum]